MTRKKVKTVRGSCLCGAVAFAVRGPFQDFTFCHCHHGLGSGVDGVVEAEVDNRGSTPITIDVCDRNPLGVGLDLVVGREFRTENSSHAEIASPRGGGCRLELPARTKSLLAITVYLDGDWSASDVTLPGARLDVWVPTSDGTLKATTTSLERSEAK